MCAGKSLFKTSPHQLLAAADLPASACCLSAFCTNSSFLPSFLRSARPHGTMILRSVLPVIFRKRPCLVTLLLSLLCWLHSPRHSKPVYLESQFHSRQKIQFGFFGLGLVGEGRWRRGVCLLFSARLLINIHPTSENQAFGTRQALGVRESGVKSPRCSYLIVSKQNVEILRRNWRRGAFCTQGQGKKGRKVFSFLFLLVPVRSPQKR